MFWNIPLPVLNQKITIYNWYAGTYIRLMLDLGTVNCVTVSVIWESFASVSEGHWLLHTWKTQCVKQNTRTYRLWSLPSTYHTTPTVKLTRWYHTQKHHSLYIYAHRRKLLVSPNIYAHHHVGGQAHLRAFRAASQRRSFVPSILPHLDLVLICNNIFLFLPNPMMVLIYKNIVLFLLDPEICATNWCKFLCFHSLKLGGQLNLEGNIGQPEIWYNNVFDVAWSKLETESFVQKCQDERDWQKSKTNFTFILTLPWETRDFGSAEMDVLLYEATIPRLTIFPLGKSRSHTHGSKGFRKFDPRAWR